MRATLSRKLTLLAALGLGWSIAVAAFADDRMSFERHAKILGGIEKDAALASLGSVRIDALTASVPLDDRMDADAAFDRPFVQAAKPGLEWYLAQRGLRIVDSGEDIRLSLRIDGYEGWKGWGRWGVKIDMDVQVAGRDAPQRTEHVTAFIKYDDDEKVVAMEKPRYRAAGVKPTFPPILFTRIVEDLGEQILVVLRNPAPAASGEAASVAAPASGRGIVSISASVPNAEAFVDGRLVATTPAAELPLSAGPHVIEVRKAGFEPWRREITVLADSRASFVAELQPER